MVFPSQPYHYIKFISHYTLVLRYGYAHYKLIYIIA